jgi:hypothetical protein
VHQPVLEQIGNDRSAIACWRLLVGSGGYDPVHLLTLHKLRSELIEKGVQQGRRGIGDPPERTLACKGKLHRAARAHRDPRACRIDSRANRSEAECVLGGRAQLIGRWLRSGERRLIRWRQCDRYLPAETAVQR